MKLNSEMGRFHNALRILLGIDYPEFEDAMKRAGATLPEAHDAWPAFRDNPHRWFIRAADRQAEEVWKIVEARQPAQDVEPHHPEAA